MVANIATYKWAKRVTCLVSLAQCHINQGHVLLNTINEVRQPKTSFQITNKYFNTICRAANGQEIK